MLFLSIKQLTIIVYTKVTIHLLLGIPMEICAMSEPDINDTRTTCLRDYPARQLRLR